MESVWGVDHGDVSKAWSRKAKENTAIGAGTAAVGAGGGAVVSGGIDEMVGHTVHSFGTSFKKTGATAARGLKLMKHGRRVSNAGLAGAALGTGAIGAGIGSKIKNRKRG